MLSKLSKAWNDAAARRRDNARFGFLKAKRLLTGSETVELIVLTKKLGREVPQNVA